MGDHPNQTQHTTAAMATGVAIQDACVDKFQELKLGKNTRYLMYKINDTHTEIIVEKVAGSSETYDSFVSQLPQDDCRYAVYDFEFETPDGGKRNKILFISWSPDSSKIKSKMLYAASKDAFRKKLVGIGNEVQATDMSEIDYQTVLEKVASTTRY